MVCVRARVVSQDEAHAPEKCARSRDVPIFPAGLGERVGGFREAALADSCVVTSDREHTCVNASRPILLPLRVVQQHV